MKIKLEYNNSVYGYTKEGNSGFWYCIKGKVPGLLSSSVAGVTVPRAFAAELTREAVKQGLASPDFFSSNIKEKKGSEDKIQVLKESVKKGKITKRKKEEE